jgi:cytochrome c-type biogenesis protein CcmH
MIAVVLLLLLQVAAPPDASMFVGAPQGKPLAGAELEQRATEVSALLRCPVCQGLAVADSPSEMAINMKRQVRDLLARGYTEEQILRYFEQSYGQFVLLKPKFEGITALVWLLPLIALVVGAFLVVRKVRSLERPAATSSDPYLARVRELVEGDKS